MVQELVSYTITAEAGVNLAVGEVVAITGAGTKGALVTVGKKTSGDKFFGVVCESASDAGKSVLVALAGVVMVKLGANATVGSYAETSSAGTAEDSEASDKAFGQFLKTGSAGELVPMLIKEIVA
jgi:hypothetical protein